MYCIPFLVSSDAFLLTPPTSFTVTEGDNLTLPCILAGNESANWTLQNDVGQQTAGFNSTDFGTVIVTPTSISIISVGRGAQGRTLVCSAFDGHSMATTLLTVLGKSIVIYIYMILYLTYLL